MNRVRSLPCAHPVRDDSLDPTFAPSDELRSITSRLWAAWTRGDVDAVIGRFSFQDGVSRFGTAPFEFLHDPSQLERYTRAEFVDFGGG